MNDLLLRAARGERTERPPVWLMRQAGRHLPEYRELRAEHSFREAITTPEVAAEITLQPWRRYRPDGLVIFSDILCALEPLGVDYRIESGVGPVIDDPVEGPGDVPTDHDDVRATLSYVGDLLARLDDEVGNEVPLLGFAGGPFTLASYLVAGGSSRGHLPLRRFRQEHPGAFESLLAVLADVVGLDWTVGMAEARAALGETPVQGNLDPSVLFADPDVVRERTREVIEAAGPTGHVLNLGHGVSKDTPVEGVEAFVEAAKSVER